MSKIIIANWKLNPTSVEDARKLARESDTEGLIICPPFPYLESVAKSIRAAELGAQDLFWEEKGAFTGEVSAPELKDIGAQYAIIGHSERRQKLGETDEMVSKKIAAAASDGIVPILCVGETGEEHEDGKAKEVVSREIKIGLSLIMDKDIAVIIAYEPIWAIGTGKPDTPENMVAMAKFIKDILQEENSKLIASVIYGGSVKSGNAEDFFKHPEIGGALVGGASLKGEEIKKIVEIGKKY